jgi:ribosomal protein S18 acetylase RimI-like enzyme
LEENDMTQVKKGIQVVQYNEGWAKGIAKMWNLSRDGWGGDTRVMTEEQVITKEAHSENIQLYLAIDGDEVVGYCSLSEYKEDTGSLYIPLLNVRPDYHGQKIGKMLVLRALEKTIELGWPRLDLYTWPGNTKAVPLYKKCGFFWEDRDDITHLMNFIPLVLKTPLLSSVFTELNWYDSSVRQIEVKPDGVKENGFTFYEYSWRNENKFARVQIERSGRGLNLIETDEYLLQILLDEHEIIEQNNQTFKIRFVNKTEKPVTIKATGSSNERVEYNINAEMVVDQETIITEVLSVKPGEEPNAWRTHPYFSVSVWVDGKECELRLGVFPVQPAKIESSSSGGLSFLNKETFIDLEIKNNLKEETDFMIIFPESEQVLLERNQYSVPLTAGGRKTISIPITVNAHGFYNPVLKVTAKKADGTKTTFEQNISIAFKGLGEKFGGETKTSWHIYNGLFQANIRKRDLLLTAAKNSDKKHPIAFFPPKLGKPFTNEFAKKKPNSISWETNENSVILKMEMVSDEMKGIFVTQMVQLFGDGVIQKWVELENRGETIFEDVAISSSLFHDLGNTYFPLDEKVVYFSENRILEFGDLNPSHITGNWYFSENKPDSIGVSWSKNSKASPEGWQFVIEDELGILEPGEKKEIEKLTLSIGAFQKWEDFRAFITQNSTVEKSELQSESQFECKQLIVTPDSGLSLSLKTYRNSYLDGSLHVVMNGTELYSSTLSLEEEKTLHSFKVENTMFEGINILEGEFKGNSITTGLKELILSPSKNELINRIVTENNYINYEVDNGCISLIAAPEFYPGIYSIKVNGSEWLDTSFPNLTAKSWWNPWGGGMKSAPSGLNTFSLMKEKHSASTIEILDLEGNRWNGLAISTEMHEHSDWKGVHFVQYYVMLPGVPVIASFIEVKNNGGKNLKNESWNTDFFVGDEDLSHLTLNVKESRYKAGIQELPIILKSGNYFSSQGKQEKLYIIPSLYTEHMEAYTNKHAQQVLVSQTTIPGENGCKTAPIFMLFDKRVINTSLLEKLRRVQF